MAGMLVKGGADVAFLVRRRRAAQLAERGLILRDDDFNSPVRTLLAGAIDGHYDVVFLACKGYDLDSAIADIAPALGPQSAVLSMLNGINQIELLEERFGSERVLGGMWIVRAELSTEGEILHLPLAIPDRTSLRSGRDRLTSARALPAVEGQGDGFLSTSSGAEAISR